jgi:hypothetical protein
MGYEPVEKIDSGDTPPERKNLFAWPFLLALAWLLYELTAQPHLAAVVVCIKFGWNDMRAAVWLRRTDPERRRGRACFWIYLASGLWKIAMTAVLTMFACAFLIKPPAPQPQAVMPDSLRMFISVALAALVGFGLSTLATCVALGLALRYRIKLWLSPTVDRARRKNAWPPYDEYTWTVNRAGRVIVTALILLSTVVVIVLVVTMLTFFQGLGPPRGAVMGGITTGLVGIPTLILALRDVLNRHTIARTPAECWGTEPLKAPAESGVQASEY